MSNYYNLLRCDEYLNESIDKLIDVFANYYGEEKRKEIEDKFRNAIIIGYMTPSHTRIIIHSLEKEKTKQLIEDELKKVELSFSISYLTADTSFRNYNIQPIYHYYEFYRLYTLGEEERKKEYLKESYNSLREFLSELTKEEYKEMVKTKKVLEKYKKVKPWIYNNIEYYIDTGNAEKKYHESFEKAKELLHKIDENITIDNFGEYLENKEIKALTHIAEQYPRMLEDYNKTLGPGTQQYKTLEDYEEFKIKIDEKYRKKFILENLDIIPEVNRKVIKDYLLGGETNYTIDRYIGVFFPKSIDSPLPIEVFSEEQDKVLEDNNESDWKKEQIRKKRIEYFKRIGIDLGNEYEVYLQNDTAKKYRPSNETIERLKNNQKEIKNKRNNELFNEEPKIKRIREKIDSAGLIDKEDSFNAKLYNENYQGTFINPNLIKTKDGYRIYPILAIRCSDSPHLDHDLIHELNHIYELSLSSVGEGKYSYCCGWDCCEEIIAGKRTEEVDTSDVSHEIRDYELYNEIINELIAQDIGNAMHRAGIYIFDTEDNSIMKHSTSYEHSFFLVKDFFEEFKEKIIESRSNGNIKIIWDEVGKENFDALNDLFKIFNENFGGFKLYKLYDDFNANKQTERTKIYNDLVRKRDEILDKMNKHSMLRNNQAEDETESVKVNQ